MMGCVYHSGRIISTEAEYDCRSHAYFLGEQPAAAFNPLTGREGTPSGLLLHDSIREGSECQEDSS